MRLPYRILNMFTVDGDRLSGNPLCVFEDGSALSTEQMQALARQLNLSETTFILPSENATARVRIFAPSFEMPFAGRPTLGTAHVEDPATGSARANLGGYFLATGAALPVTAKLLQGEAVKRPSHLGLRVDADRGIYVSGNVVELGGGSFDV